MKKSISVLLTLVLALSMFVIPVSASENLSEPLQVSPDGMIAEIPYYYYRISHYDGSSETTRTYTREVNVPNGYTVHVGDAEIKSIVYDTWYNNVKVKQLTRWEYSYYFVRK